MKRHVKDADRKRAAFSRSSGGNTAAAPSAGTSAKAASQM
jgi:hypothetical protein